MSENRSVPSKWLVFVDTNVLLDFYRLRGNNALDFLKQINDHQGSLILTRQVFMEFLKNRRLAVLSAFSELLKPSVQKLPPNLRGLDVAEEMVASLNAADACYKKVKEKTELIVTNPSEHDEVFKLVSQLFLGLDHTNESVQFQRAQERSLRGYPPRKDKDTSFGDALNWEAMLQAIEDEPEKTNLFIVSRDGDFSDGPRGREINEWLLHEFKERFGQDREVVLSDSLSQALKLLGESVSQEVVEEENEVINQNEQKTARMKSDSDSALLARLGNHLASETDLFVKHREKMALLADPFVKHREQMALLADPFVKHREQMALLADPIAKFQKQMEDFSNLLGKLPK